MGRGILVGDHFFLGLGNVKFSGEPYDLGNGLVMGPASAEVNAPVFLNLSPGLRNGPAIMIGHRARGGYHFDISAQLSVPRTQLEDLWEDEYSAAWFLAAIIRLRLGPGCRIPLISEHTMASETVDHSEKFRCLQFAEECIRRDFTPTEITDPSKDDLKWIEDNWKPAVDLFLNESGFGLLFRAFDRSMVLWDPLMSLAAMWAGIEAIFSPSRTELRFRVSAYSAAFLRQTGNDRLRLQAQIAKLYDARSRAGHGSERVPENALRETYDLARELILKIVETKLVPQREDLDMMLFSC